MIPSRNLTVYMCKLAGAVGICGLMQSNVKWTRASHGNGSSETVQLSDYAEFGAFSETV